MNKVTSEVRMEISGSTSELEDDLKAIELAEHGEKNTDTIIKELSVEEKKQSLKDWDAKNRAAQTTFFGRDHRSIDRHRRGSAFGLQPMKSHELVQHHTEQPSSSPQHTPSSSSSSASSSVHQHHHHRHGTKITNEFKIQRKKRRRRRSSIKENLVKRFSVREQARKHNKKRRKTKICCLLRSPTFRSFLLNIFGERYDVAGSDMHVLASTLSPQQRCTTMTYVFLYFFLYPLLFGAVLWSIPLIQNDETTNTTAAATTSSSSTTSSTMTTTTHNLDQVVYFWCILPIVLSTLAVVPALWYHNTTSLPLSTSIFTSILSVVIPGLGSAHALSYVTRSWNALLAIGVGFICTNGTLFVVSIRHGLALHAAGGYRSFRAAIIIQKGWATYRGGRGTGMETVKKWHEKSAIDDHSVVMDEVALFRGIDPTTKTKMQLVMQPREFKQGEHICTEGELGQHFYVIVRGSVSVRCKAKPDSLHGGGHGGRNGGRKTSTVEEEEEEDGETDKKIKEIEMVSNPTNSFSFGSAAVELGLKTECDVEICRMHGGDYFGEVALLAEDNSGHVRSASVVVVSSQVECLAISSHNFRKSVLPHLSKEATGRLMRACRRRLDHTAEFRLEHQPVANFIRRSLSSNNMLTGMYEGTGGSDMSSSEEDDSDEEDEEEVEKRIKQNGGRTTRYLSAPSKLTIDTDAMNATNNTNKTNTTPGTATSTTSTTSTTSPASTPSTSSTLSTTSSTLSTTSTISNTSTRATAGTKFTSNRRLVTLNEVSSSMEDDRDSILSERSSAGMDTTPRRSTIEGRPSWKSPRMSGTKSGRALLRNAGPPKGSPLGNSNPNATSSFYEDEDEVKPYNYEMEEEDEGKTQKKKDSEMNSKKEEFRIKMGHVDSSTMIATTASIDSPKRPAPLEPRHRNVRSTNTPLGKSAIRRRGSSFRLAVKHKDGRRRTHSGNFSDYDPTLSAEKRNQKKYQNLRNGVRRQACATAFALFTSFLMYPVFLFYLWGFTKIASDTELKKGPWLPLYTLLVGPLRLLFQSLGEKSLAKADIYTARAGGAWTLALGEFFRIAMFGFTSDPFTLVSIVMVDVLRHGMLLSLLNRNILITVYRGTSSRVRARVDIAVEICLTILTDSVGALVTLVVIPVQYFSINKESFAFYSPGNSCTGKELSLPAIVVFLSLLFKFVLFVGVRFMLLRDYSIDLVNVLHYLLKRWRWTILTQLVCASTIVYVLLLNQAGVEIISDVIKRNCTSCDGNSFCTPTTIG